MNARITDIDRGAGADESRYDVYAYPYTEASPHVFTTAGQLWEREAERQVGDPETGELSPRLSYALYTSRRTPGPVAGYVRERGERRGVASGMIIAGEVREHQASEAAYQRTQHRHYVHTGFEAGAL